MGATTSSFPVSVTHRVVTDTLKTEDSSQLSLSHQYLCIVYSYIHHIYIYIWLVVWNMEFPYLRAAAPAADPGRIGKEAKQIGIKTLRCFAP